VISETENDILEIDIVEIEKNQQHSSRDDDLIRRLIDD